MPAPMGKLASAVAAIWDANTHKPPPPRSRWWMSPTIVRHINRIVCGEDIDGVSAGFHRMLKQHLPTGMARKAVSVGCGTAQKEISLVEMGLVDSFHLYEISKARIDIGRQNIDRRGLSNRITFHHEDAFEACQARDFDLVYWNNALHHMMDTRQAVQWSFDRLGQTGLFAMDDFVGPSRFQWTDRMLEFGTLIRAWMSDHHLSHPTDETKTIPRVVKRPSIAKMIKADPSEAADSANIIPAIKSVFPESQVTATGGTLYHTALNDILANLDPVRDRALLFSILATDHALALEGETQYAVAFAWKR